MTIPTSRRRLAWLLPLLLGAAACTGSAVVPEVELTMYVGPQQVECMAVGPRLCLLVRYHPGEEWQRFYDPIEGFSYQPGYLYTLRVRRRHVANPPADGSSAEWRLLRILERTPA